MNYLTRTLKALLFLVYSPFCLVIFLGFDLFLAHAVYYITTGKMYSEYYYPLSWAIAEWHFTGRFEWKNE